MGQKALANTWVGGLVGFQNNQIKTTAMWLSKNSAQFIGYSIASVLDAVDQAIVVDDGSTDNTMEIVLSLKSPKIQFTKSNPQKYNMDWNIRYAMSHASGQAIIFLDDDYVWDDANAGRIQKNLMRALKQKKKGVSCYAYNISPKPGYYTTVKHTPDLLLHWPDDRVQCGGSFYTDTNHLTHQSELGRFREGGQRVRQDLKDYLDAKLVFSHWKFIKDTKEEFIKKLCLFVGTTPQKAEKYWYEVTTGEITKYPHPIPEVFRRYRDLFVPLGGFDVLEWEKNK